MLEDRGLAADDVIKEEDEDEADEDDEDGGHEHNEGGEGAPERAERDALLSSPVMSARSTSRPRYKSRNTLLKRLGGFGRHRKSVVQNNDEADLLEATYNPSAERTRYGRGRPGMTNSVSSIGTQGTQATDDAGLMSPALHAQARMQSFRRRESADRRTSISSGSSHEADVWSTRRRNLPLGLVEMDPSAVPDFAHVAQDEEEGEERPVYIWTANNDYGTVLRIGFKKRISALWLEAYALKQYVELNLTAFEKILKK